MSDTDSIQHGGTHYKVPYEHWNMVADLGLCYYIANATKYVTRHRKKNGLEDVEKARHYILKKIELINAGRTPGPYEPPLQIQLAKAELLNRFADANGIDPESDEFRFIESAALAQSMEEYTAALAYATRIIERYKVAQVSAPASAAPFPQVPSHVAALIEKKQFNVEGWWGDLQVLWKCQKCKLYFKAKEGMLPSQVHTSCGVAAVDPTPAYVDQG